MADSLAQLKHDRKYWQRMLRFAGYYKGKTDGIIGAQSKAAEAQWLEDSKAIKEYLGGFDERSESNLETLLPKTQREARIWLAKAKQVAHSQGFEVRIICGTRSYKEQDALFAKRPRVTQARGGQSMHNFGLAWDFGVFSSDAKKYFGSHALYDTLGKLSRSQSALFWGGDWASFVDRPHIQLSSYSTSSSARAQFEV